MRLITGKFKDSIDKLQRWEHKEEGIDLTHEEKVTVQMEELERNEGETEIDDKKQTVEMVIENDKIVVKNQEYTQAEVMIDETVQQEPSEHKKPFMRSQRAHYVLRRYIFILRIKYLAIR